MICLYKTMQWNANYAVLIYIKHEYSLMIDHSVDGLFALEGTEWDWQNIISKLYFSLVFHQSLTWIISKDNGSGWCFLLISYNWNVLSLPDWNDVLILCSVMLHSYQNKILIQTVFKSLWPLTFLKWMLFLLHRNP